MDAAPCTALRAQFTEPRTYESVLRAIAGGAVTPGTIADAAGLREANRVNPYLDRLVALGFVERRVPPGDAARPRARTSQYVLSDQYLRFYYALVDPWRSAIQLGEGAAVLDAMLGARLDEFVSRAFEEVCREHVRRLAAIGRLEPLSEVGFWWFAGGDIDVAGMSGGSLVVAGSAKWTTAFVKPGDLDDLRRSVELVAPGSRPALFLFGRSGFDPNLRKELGIELVGPADLFRAELEWEGRVGRRR